MNSYLPSNVLRISMSPKSLQRRFLRNAVQVSPIIYILLASLAAAPKVRYVTLSGEVHECISKNPVARAHVLLYNTTQRTHKTQIETREDGKFETNAQIDDVYTIKIIYNGALVAVKQGWKVDGTTPLMIEIGEIKLKGKIVVPANSEFKNPTVFVQSLDDNYAAAGTILKNGDFELDNLPSTVVDVTLMGKIGSRIRQIVTQVDLTKSPKNAEITKLFDAPESSKSPPTTVPTSPVDKGDGKGDIPRDGKGDIPN